MTHHTRLFPAGILLAALPLGAQSPAPGNAADMAPYSAKIATTAVEIPMVPIPVGADGYPTVFTMGSPDGEAERGADEGPAVQIEVEPFWIGRFEVTWDTFDEFQRQYQALSNAGLHHESASEAQWADAVSFPTPLYEQDAAPILEGMGTKGGYPVVNITQFAARQFTKWLSKKTGHFYRLPTEAEWEYAARAGTTTAFSFGDDVEQLGEYAIFFDNSAYEDPAKGHPDFSAGYRTVGSKKANSWGIHDMYGNVAEWVIDRYTADGYAGLGASRVGWKDAIGWPERAFPCVARGGSWESDPAACRSAARLKSDPAWQQRDPQLPRSIWWFTDGFHVGFRIVRPLREPPPEEQQRFWESPDAGIQRIITAGGKEVRAAIDRAGSGADK